METYTNEAWRNNEEVAIYLTRLVMGTCGITQEAAEHMITQVAGTIANRQTEAA